MSIFKKRVNYKPFEYPGVYQFTDAINKSFWVHSEVDFTADTQDFNVKLEPYEKEACKRALLSIAQVEVAVKSFWGDLYKHFPKPEFNGLGATFAECYIEGTEVLTKRGWVEIKDVTKEDSVATFDSNRKIYFDHYKNKIVKKPSGNLIKFSSKDHISIVTENHNMRVYENGSNTLTSITAKDLNVSNSAIRFPVSQGTTNDYFDTLHVLSFEERLKIAIQADGCVRHFRNKEGDKVTRGISSNTVCYELTFKKQEKIERLQWILDNLNYKYFKRVYDYKTQFEVFVTDNNLKSFDWLYSKIDDKDWCKAVIAELSHWDGIHLVSKKNCRIKYSTTSKSCADTIQAVGTIAGYKTNLITAVDNRSENFNDTYIVSFNVNRETLPVTSLTKESANYNSMVYCLDMGNGNLITRFEDKTFFGGNCEFRHSEAYSRLLEVLGYNDEFEKLMEIPVFKKKFEYINSVMGDESKSIDEKLLFFTLVIENSSLFSQFAIMLSFTRFKGYMKNVSNIIAWTSVDEQIHAQAGIYIINEIRKEKEIFKDIDIPKLVSEYVTFEEELLDWIFEEGELDFFTKKNLLDFIKNRIDMSLKDIGFQPVFKVSNRDVATMTWFEEEIYANSLDDFFSKRPVDYAKHDKPITANDLF